MKILFQSRTPLPVSLYGGTERMQMWLMKELVRQGHQVVFVGPASSRVSEAGVEHIHLEPQYHLDWAHLIPSGVDVVHLFEEVGFKVPTPYLVTIGGNGQPGQQFDVNTVFVSGKHAANHGSDRFVYNGLDFEDLPTPPQEPKDWDNFVFLAKASWKVKNLRHCVKACRKARKHLHIGGGRSWTPSRYIHSWGMVDQERKAELLAQGDALLFPVRWEEPFGIAIVEAFAMGLPVIGSPYGSLPELITENMGIICKSYEELLAALKDSSRGRSFSAAFIREQALARFSIAEVARQYLKLYAEVQSRPLNSKRPVAQFTERPVALLPF